MNVKFIPNILSFIRLLLVPVYVVSFFLINKYVALAIFILASITDFIDGYIARKFNAITELGKVLDPLADKLLKMSALITLTCSDLLPLWVTILMIICDVAMIISGICIYKKQITIPSNWIGKLGTIIITLGVIMSFFTEWLGNANVYVIYFGIAVAITSGFDYVYIFFAKKLKKKKSDTNIVSQNETNDTQEIQNEENDNVKKL